MNRQDLYMQRGSTFILRAAVMLIGLIVFALCIGIIFLITDGEQDYRTPIWIGLYVAAIPFYIALYQTLNLLNYIDKDKTFSNLSVKALSDIKYCAVAISALFAVGMPYVFYVADRDDSPGLAAAGFVIIGASFVIATFAGVLQKLLQNAIKIKKENDLTV